MASELNSLADANGSPKDQRPLLKSASDSPRSPSLPAESIEEMEKKYAAYVRSDAYGTMGRGELPLKERLLLGLAFVTLVPIRLVSATLVLVLYYLICRVCTLFSDPNHEDGQEDYAHMVGWRREAVVRSGRFLGRVMLFCFGFYWISETRPDNSKEPSPTMNGIGRISVELQPQADLHSWTKSVLVTLISFSAIVFNFGTELWRLMDARELS